MRSGLRPIHSVETMTWTSEMSGTASSGVFVMAQMPHAVNTTVPVNTTKRFDAHQSMVRLIITCILAGPTAARWRGAARYESLCSRRPQALAHHHRELLGAKPLTTARDRDCHVPPAGHHHLPRSSICTAAGPIQLRLAPHRR